MAVGADDRPADVGHPLLQRADHRGVLEGRRVADGVGDVHRGGPGLDGRLDDLAEEVELGPRGVLGAELDVRAIAPRPGGRPRPPSRRSATGSSAACARGGSPRWRGRRGSAATGHTGSPPRPGRCRARCTGPARRPTSRRPRWRWPGPPRSRRPRRSGTRPRSRQPPARPAPGQLELLGHVHARARRLLAVAQRRVEDPHPVRLGLGGTLVVVAFAGVVVLMDRPFPSVLG